MTDEKPMQTAASLLAAIRGSDDQRAVRLIRDDRVEALGRLEELAHDYSERNRACQTPNGDEWQVALAQAFCEMDDS